MTNIKIAVINQSTVVNDADVVKTVAALQTQVMRDFAPIWGINADLRVVPHGQHPAANEW